MTATTPPAFGPPVLWEVVKFDRSLHRSARAVALGETADGRWLLVREGTPVFRPGGRDYRHPCDAVILVPPTGMWTATWLVDWDPSLHVDIALHRHNEPQRVVTVDLDIDVIRRRDGTVEVLDRAEFEQHRRELGYPAHLVDAVERAAAEVEAAVYSHEEPFRVVPAVPASPGTPDEG